MSDPLYAKDLLRLAALATGTGRLEPHDAAGSAHNPVCGDKVSVTLRMNGEKIAALGHETRACVLVQASASILGGRLAGSSGADVAQLRKVIAAMLETNAPAPEGFKEYEALTGARAFRNRHACVLLPVDAVLNALRGVSNIYPPPEGGSKNSKA